MKADAEHRVPLTDVAVAVLRKLPRKEGNPYVFPGVRQKLPLSNMAMLELLRDMRKGLTVHGFRSTFRDWCAEQTNFPREIAERALAHTLGDETERAYQRGDLLEKRRKLMQAWARFCMSGVRPGVIVNLYRVTKRGG
jgi:integrase